MWTQQEPNFRTIKPAGYFFKILPAALIALTLLMLSPSSGQAQFGEEDETVRAPASLNKAEQRRYPGGRDEQDLEVQPTLPQPTRNIEAMGAPIPESGSSEASRD